MAGKFDYLLGKHLSIISKAGARYTGVFVGADQVESTITLEDIYFHGTEDRPVPKKAPGGQRLGGPVSFKTPSIVSLEEATDHPGAPVEEAFVDPALPSNISLEPPKASTSAQNLRSPPTGPRAPSADSASTALDRVQQSLSQLSTGPSGASASRGRGRGGFHQQSRPAPEVPSTDFDFSGTAAFASQRERDSARAQEGDDGGVEDLGEIENVHPAAVSATSPPPDGESSAPGRKSSQSAVYEKDDFFDNLSGANEKRGAGRTNRNVEREKNLDAFGDAGDSAGGPMGGGPRGGLRGIRIGFAGRGAFRGGRGYARGGAGGEGGGYGGSGGFGGERRGGYGGGEGYSGQREGGFGGDRSAGGGRGWGRGGYSQRGGGEQQ